MKAAHVPSMGNDPPPALDTGPAVAPPPEGGFDTAAVMGGLYGPGIIGCQGAFSVAWADRLRADIELLFAEAQRRPQGALPRGPQRWYVEVHPERISGFVDIASHPWLVGVCSAVLGPNYRIVEVGFDIPHPGAQDQPWHRDFPAPEATRVGRRLDSLAFNLTAVDTTPEMGPLEIAPGTQWDDWTPDCAGDADREAAMFPPASWAPRYAARAEHRMPQRGDMSARSALTVHRGTANRSSQTRPVLVIGVDAPDAGNGARHDLQATAAWLAALPAVVREHLPARVVEQLQPIRQDHGIAGLV